MGNIKTVYVFHSISNIALAHTPRIHGQYLVLDPADIFCTFGNCFGFKASFPVPGHGNIHFPICSMDGIMGITIAPVRGILFPALVVSISQVGIHFILEHGLKHRTEDVLDGILHLFPCLRLVFLHNCLCDCCSFCVLSVSSCHKCCTHPFLHPFFECSTPYTEK